MELALIGLVAVALIVVAYQHRLQGKMYDHLCNIHDATLLRMQDERRELLNRIQHPGRMPTKAPVVPPRQVDPATRRALQQVGKVAPQVATDGD